MQFKLSLVTVALATLAAATPTPRAECSTGSLLCCDSTGSPSEALISRLLGLLGISVQDVTALVGVTCAPITVIGAGTNSCTAQPVCCTDNSFKGVVALGCSPINL